MSDAPADYETRRWLCNTIDEAVAEWQRSLSPRPLPEYLANVLGDAGVQVVAVVRPTRDAAMIAISNMLLDDERALHVGEFTYQQRDDFARDIADAVFRVAVSDSQPVRPTRDADWQAIAKVLYDELRNWGFGDFHYGNQPRDEGVLAALAVYDVAAGFVAVSDSQETPTL